MVGLECHLFHGVRRNSQGLLTTVLEYEVFTFALFKVILEILQRPDFHRPLRFLSFSAHVRQQRDVAEFQELRVDMRLVGINVDSSCIQLSSISNSAIIFMTFRVLT